MHNRPEVDHLLVDGFGTTILLVIDIHGSHNILIFLVEIISTHDDDAISPRRVCTSLWYLAVTLLWLEANSRRCICSVSHVNTATPGFLPSLNIVPWRYNDLIFWHHEINDDHCYFRFGIFRRTPAGTAVGEDTFQLTQTRKRCAWSRAMNIYSFVCLWVID